LADILERNGLRAAIGVERVGHDGVGRKVQRHAFRFRVFDDRGRGGEIRIAQRCADVDPLRGEKRVGHAAADHEGIHAREQIFEDADFVGDLRPADRAHERLRRVHRQFGERASSASIKSPAYAGRSLATPTVDACARCAVPKASFT